MKKALLIMGLLAAWQAACFCQTAERASAEVASASAARDGDMQHSPRKALLLSLLPGAGQIYNAQAWKLPIIYGAFAGVGYFIYDNYKDRMMYKNEYMDCVQDGRLDPEDIGIYNMYQRKNKSFQTFIIAAAAVYGLNLLDAYVFGHLYDFQINDDLALRLSPSVAPDWSSSMGLTPSLQLSLRF